MPKPDYRETQAETPAVPRQVQTLVLGLKEEGDELSTKASKVYWQVGRNGSVVITIATDGCHTSGMTEKLSQLVARSASQMDSSTVVLMTPGAFITPELTPDLAAQPFVRLNHTNQPSS